MSGSKGRIPQEILDEIIARTDIVDVVGRYVPLKNKGRTLSVCALFIIKDAVVFGVAEQADLSLLRLRRRRRCHHLYYEGGRSDLPGCGTLSRRAGGHADTRTG